MNRKAQWKRHLIDEVDNAHFNLIKLDDQDQIEDQDHAAINLLRAIDGFEMDFRDSLKKEIFKKAMGRFEAWMDGDKDDDMYGESSGGYELYHALKAAIEVLK